MNRNVVIRSLDAHAGRTIIISDIHANLKAYHALLKKVGYRPQIDRLIIDGDFLEKGHDNLAILHELMRQSQTEDVHCIMGNCDFVCKNALYSYRLTFLRKILLMRPGSVLNEMGAELGLKIKPDTDMAVFCQTIRRHFLAELAFVNDLPHVIETPDTIIAHSAIQSPDHYGDDFREVINHSFYLREDLPRFEKRVVVGHMPVTEYCRRIASFNPIYDASRNIYSIDGGNVVKSSGQLNALILEGNRVSYASWDDLPETTVLEDVPAQTVLPFFVNWNEGHVTIRKCEGRQLYVYNEHLNRSFWVDEAFYRDHKVSEYTNYQMPLKKGERVKIVFPYGDQVQIKKNGILGWTYTSSLAFFK
ncbi:MAG: metallophosphoesterase [Catenisphaera adipataccumulans]|jgi:hypothetical protein|uniref:metallophosphoesterase n=1 Tax=Catenisphaera adipataccumulans TaxID=700500 RepID=UPI003D8F827F